MNPKQMVMQMLNRTMNPMLRNLIKMDPASLENFARNYCKENGRDFDTEFRAFMQGKR